MENPWNIQSIYDFQYFNCPSCVFIVKSKQEFLNHAFCDHPESIYDLTNISDGSLNDVQFPWNLQNKKIKTEESKIQGHPCYTLFFVNCHAVIQKPFFMEH